MPASRKTRRAKRSSTESSSSESDDELVNEFFRGDRKLEKIKKEEPVPSYTTRSGRKIIPKFGKLSLQERRKELSSSSSETGVLSDDEKPAQLFEDDQAIESKLFGFKTPKKKHSMLTKASDSVTKTQASSPETKVRGSRGQKKEAKASASTATPMAARRQFKNKISREATKQTLKIEESDSDFDPTASESETSDSDDPVPLDEVTKPPTPVKEEPAVRRSARNRGTDKNFIFTSDDYFERQNTRSVTSDHNLNKLKTPRMQHDQLMSLLQDLNTKHKEAYKELDVDNQAMFKKWLVAMSQGFNVLLYGVGSKRTLLNTFHSKHLASSPTLVVNGFFPGITLKDILDALILNVLKLKTAPAQPHEAVEILIAKLKSVKQPDVFVLIHNLDGPALCVEKAQAALASLAAIPKVHLVASIDHINAPLLWDQNKLSQFNFIWEDATTFLHYFEETSFESSLMVQRSGAMALTSLRNVFQSLTANARKVFSLLMEHQLKNPGKHYQGMLFSDLYRACRSAFIVSSDLALRTQLTEFFDHKLVKHKKETDQLQIQIDANVLRQFSDEISADE